MDGSLNFLRRMRDRDANRHARRRAAQRPPRWPWGGNNGRASRRLILALGTLLVGCMLAGVLAGNGTISSLSITALNPADVIGGVYRKGAAVRFAGTFQDSTTPAELPSTGPFTDVIQSDGSTVQQTVSASGNDGGSILTNRRYFFDTTVPGGIAPTRQDTYTWRFRVKGGHIPPAYAAPGDAEITSSGGSIIVGFTPQITQGETNPRVGTQDSVYEWFVLYRDEDGDAPYDNGTAGNPNDDYPRIYVNDGTGGGGTTIASGVTMVPFNVNGSTGNGQPFQGVSAGVGQLINPAELQQEDYRNGVWYRYCVDLNGAAPGNLPNLGGVNHFSWRVIYRDIDGVPNASSPTVRNTVSYWPGPTAGNWQTGPQMWETTEANFYPCVSAGVPDTNPYNVNEGGVFVDPRDPNSGNDRQATGSSTIQFRFYYPDPYSANLATPSNIPSWKNAFFDPWRDLDGTTTYPSGLGNKVLMIRFDDNGDGVVNDTDRAHFMQRDANMWQYTVQPTDVQANNAAAIFNNGGQGKVWDNNFENFLYRTANLVSGMWIPSVARPEGVAPVPGGYIRFRYEVSPDIQVWSARTSLTSTGTAAYDLNNNTPDSWPANIYTNPTGRPYPQSPDSTRTPNVIWQSYTGRNGSQAATYADRFKVDPILRADTSGRPDGNPRPEIFAPAHFAAANHVTYNPETGASSPTQITVPDFGLGANAIWTFARGTTATLWPIRVQYFQSDNRPPLRHQVHILRKSGNTYSAIAGSPFNTVEENAADTSYNNGKWYRYTSALSPGTYRYYFEFSDGTRTTYWPGEQSETGAGTSLHALNIERTINTFRVNNACVLSNPSVSPNTGPEDGVFTYRVRYTDADNDRPLRPYLFIEQPAGSNTWVRATMVQSNTSDTNYTDGADFEYMTGTDFQLDPGTHRYYFAFVDNWNNITDAIEGERTALPTTGKTAPFTDPTVVRNTAPKIKNGTVTEATGTSAGTTATVFTFRATYEDAENQPPASMQVWIDPLVTNRGSNTVNTVTGARTLTANGMPAGTTPGDLIRFTGGAAAGRWYHITDVNGNNITISPGFSLTDVDGDGAPGPTVGNPDAFDIVRLSKDNAKPSSGLFAMAPVNASDNLYIDGADFQYQTRLSIGSTAGGNAHSFIFVASDGFSTLVDSTDTSAEPGSHIVPKTGPDVSVNNAPVLGIVADDGAASATPGAGTMVLGATGKLWGTNVHANRLLKITGGPAANKVYTIVSNVTNQLTLQPGPTNLTAPLVAGTDPAADGVVATNPFEILVQGVTPILGDANTTFTWSIVYTDPDGNSPEAGAPAGISVVIDGTAYPMQRQDQSVTNFTGRVAYVYSRTLGPGAHTYKFEANDGANSARYPTDNSTLSYPVVNNLPTLAPTATPLNPTSGGSATQFTFEVEYRDQDNDPPDAGFPKVTLDGSRTFAMVPKDPADNLYTDGKIYTFTYDPSVHGQLASALFPHNHTYQFYAESLSSLLGVNRHQVWAPNQANTYNGPTTNDAPTLNDRSTTPVTSAVAPGSQAGTYTFQARYQDPDDDAPLTITVSIFDPNDQLVGQYNMTVDGAAPGAGSYIAGVNYKYTASGLTAPGQYRYRFAAADALGLAAASVDGTPPAPFINTLPVISQLNVSPANGPAGTTFTYSARYRDANGQLPSGGKLTLWVYKPDLTTKTSYDLTTTETTDITTTGRVYSTAAPITLNDKGVHAFYIEASDGVDTVYAPNGGQSNGNNADKRPTIFGPPALSNATVNPSAGTLTTSFTWTVTYSDVDNQRPTGTPAHVRVYISKDAVRLTDAANGNVDYFRATQVDPGDTNYMDGATFALSMQLSQVGNYTYHFEVTDTGGDDATPTPEAQGPAVNTDGPMLTLGKVTNLANSTVSDMLANNANGTVNDTFTYTVLYAHGQNLAPETIQAYIDGVAANMTKTNPSQTNFTAGVQYQYETKLAAGSAHNFYFGATTGTKSARTPETGVINGPTVNNTAPTLTLGGVNPSRGTTATEFTYSVTYTDADGQAPQTLQVFVDGGGQSMTLSNVESTTPYKAVYTYKTKLSGGMAHNYYFTASDGTAAARFPASNAIDGPSVPNTAPVLTAGTVTPSGGATTTTYSFTVIYSDTTGGGDAPAQIDVFIDGVGKPMLRDTRAATPGALKDNDFLNGEQYYYETNSLAVGTHSYFFQATDSRPEAWQQETVRFPQSGSASGPTVVTNSLPVLSNAGVSFPVGTTPTTATFFTYSVTYKDADNNPPGRIQVFISKDSGGSWQAMDLAKADPTDSTYTDGCVYQLVQRYAAPSPTSGPSTNPTGPTTYRFYFEAVDTVELTVVRAPANGASGPLVGPTVYDNRTPTVAPVGSFTLVRTRKDSNPGNWTPADVTMSGISPQPVGVPQTLRYPYGRMGGPPEVTVLDPVYRYARFQELTLRARYQDADNQPPQQMVAMVNSNPTPMVKENPDDNNYAAGVVYIASIQLNSNFTGLPGNPNNSSISTAPDRGANSGDSAWWYSFEANDSNDPTTRTTAGGASFNVNIPPTLESASYGSATGGNTSATVWTFSVTYVDRNCPNNPFYNTASGDRPIYVRVVIDGVAKDMVAGGDTDYHPFQYRNSMKPGWVSSPTDWPQNNGSTFTFSTPLPIGSHTYYFETTDGWDVVKTNEANGPTIVNSAPVISTPPTGGLSPLTGTQAADYTYTAIYKDVDNQPPSKMEVVIDGSQRFSMQKDPNENDYTKGVTYRYTTKLAPGAHDYRFEAEDSNSTPASVRFPATQNASGPTINFPPVLASGTVSPANGNTGTLYTFTVNYSDGDGQAPSYIKVFIDGTGFDMTKVDPTQNDFKQAIAYKYETKLPGVPHTFYFKASDGQEEVTTTTLSGPSVNPNNTPPQLSNLAVAPAKGGPNTTFTFSATYTDADNDRPDYVRARIYASSAGASTPPVATLDLAKADPTNTAYNAGVVYSATLATLTGPDIYRFYVEASDAKDGDVEPAGANTTPSARIAMPTVNRAPVLTSGIVDPTVGGPTTNYVFTVTYQDPDNTDPALATGLSSVPAGLSGLTANEQKPGIFLELTDANKVKTVSRMLATSNTFATGATFQIQRTLAAGSYGYRFLAWDGIDYVTFPGTGTLTGPQVNPTNPPSLTNASVSPDPGYKNDSYVYRVTYTDLDNTAPALLELYIDGTAVPSGDIQREDTNAFSKGTVYSYTRTAGSLALGTHAYYWKTSDGGVEIRLPQTAGTTLTGPVVRNNAPTLTAGSVSPTTGRVSTEFVYTVLYDDDDDDPPAGGVTVLIDGQPKQMTLRADQAGRKYSDGVTYEYRVSGLDPGSHDFSFAVSDGTDSAQTTTYTGPTVNNPPVLAPSGATVTPAVRDPGLSVTFSILYSDVEGTAPDSIRVFIHKRPPDNPDTAVAGYTMQPQGGAPTQAQIRNGVLYTVTVNGLQKGTYSHYFVASDGVDATEYPQGARLDPDLRRVGPTMNSAAVLSLPTSGAGVTPAGGEVSDQYTFRVVYKQKDNVAPQYVRVHVDGAKPGRGMTAVAGQNDYVAGVTYEVTASGNDLTTTPKPHNFHFSAFDGIQECYLDQSGLTYDVRPNDAIAFTGPMVNDRAMLSAVRITAIDSANPTVPVELYAGKAAVAAALPTQRIRFEVLYADVNNDPAQQVELYLDGNTTPIAMADAGTDAGDPARWSKGVYFTYTSTQPLSPGSHSFVIRANDGGAWTYESSGPRDATDPRKVDLSQGNVAAPAVQTLVNPRVTPNSGGLGTEFEFSASYVSLLSSRAGHLDGLNTSVTITQPSGAILPPLAMTYTGDATTGVTLRAKTRLTEVGDHSFKLSVNDGQFTYTSTPVAQPRVAKLELADLKVTPTKGIVGRGFEFSVAYRHAGWQPAGSVKLFIYKPSGDLLAADGYAMSTSEVNTALLSTVAGWKYSVTVPIETAGTYSYKVVAADGDPALGATQLTTPETGTASGPEVTPPTLTAPAVSPMTGGYAGGIFTFSVKYTAGANRPPAFVRLRLTKPDGTAADPVDLVAAAEGDYVNGKVYTKSIALTNIGEHSFFFEAGEKDAAGTLVVTSTSATVAGLQAAKPAAPELSDAEVNPATTGGNRFTYTVVYKQSQKLAPAWVRLYIDYSAETGQAMRVVDMTRLDATATAYDTGVTYTYTTPEALAPGRHNYRITASNGFEEATPVDGTGPLINREPTIEPKKVSPERGDENTTFTFEAIYKDADNQAAEFVKISVGNKAYTLQKVDATDDNFVDGALYRVQIQLPAGDLSHSFQASDGIATVRAPATGVVAGPKVLPKTNITLSLNRAGVSLDAQTSVTATGTLEPVVSNVAVKVTFNAVLPQADGTTVEETRTTLEVQTDSDGKFTASAVPDQDGTWNIRAEYAGDVAQGGTRGSGKAVAAFTVDPARYVLTPAVHMLGLPNTPAAGDLRRIITGGEFQTAHYTGNKDVPYLYGPDLPFPTPLPGIGFWLRGGTNLQVSASGRLVDHKKEFAIPVRPGWQIISNPYLMPVDWQAADFSAAGQRVRLMQAGEWVKSYAWTWDSRRSEFRLLHGAYMGFFEQTDRDLQPWQGAFFYSRVSGELILAPPTGGRAETDDQRSARARHRSTEREWSIQLRAANGRESDGFNYAGVTSQGRGATYSSMASPPSLPGYVDLYFQGPDAGSRYATDFRAPVAGEHVWDFTVETDVLDRPVTINSPDLSRLPKTLEVLLEDVDAGGKRIYMRTSGGYTFNPGDGGKRQMRLIVRPRAEGALRIVQVDLAPTRGGRSFNVTLSQDAMVSIEILSPSGQELAVVTQNKPTADSRTSAFWDETRKDGVRLPAGVYLARVTAKLPEGQVTQSVRPLVLAR